MEYSVSFQEIGAGNLGHTLTESIPEVGDWITVPEHADKRYEVKNRLFRYDSKAQGTKDKSKEWPMVVLFVKELPEGHEWRWA